MGLPLIHYYPPRHQGLEGDCAERSEVKTSQCDVFKESVAETLNCEHAAASACEVLALIKPTDGAPVPRHQGLEGERAEGKNSPVDCF